MQSQEELTSLPVSLPPALYIEQAVQSLSSLSTVGDYVMEQWIPYIKVGFMEV